MGKAIVFIFLAALLLSACTTLATQEPNVPAEDVPIQATPAQSGTHPPSTGGASIIP